jgi:four helix bundle protein
MDFEQWERDSAAALSGDPIWRMKAYRMALFALEPAWDDALRFRRHAVLYSVANQLYRAVGSIAANLSEGYSRSSGADRVRFFEYALGTTREAHVWYYSGRRVLSASELDARLDLLTNVRRMVLAAIPEERRRIIRPSKPS